MLNKFGYLLVSIINECKDIIFWSALPKNKFTKNGFIIIENFLEPNICDSLVEVGQKNLKASSQMLGENSWINVRAEAEDGRDSKVKNIFNFDELAPELNDLIKKGKLTEAFEEQLQTKMVLKTCSLQIDDPDTRTKRSWHVDTNPPPTFKAFIYLTDVESELEGPYCAIPKSHRWRMKRILNIVVNLLTGSKRSDMHRFVGERNDFFLAKKGTLIFSTQTLFHRGSPKHEKKTRYMLINYYKAEKYDDGLPFTLGRPTKDDRE